jgi:hypothetical protein
MNESSESLPTTKLVSVADITVMRHSPMKCRHCDYLFEANICCNRGGRNNCPNCGCPVQKPING